jgi:tetratricopeptide (TPR) repeat protein
MKEFAAKAHAKACIAKAGTAWNQGAYFESLGDRKNAAGQFREAATLAPDNADYTRKAGAYAFTEGDLKSARHWLVLSLQIRPLDAEARALLAMVYEAAGHLHNALREAEKALELAPERKDVQLLIKRLKSETTR